MRYVFGLILLIFAGCNTVEITSVTIDKSKVQVSAFLEDNFTPQAIVAIRGIKIYEGMHLHPYVSGVNFWSDAISFLIFNGIGRKIITTRGTLEEGCPRETIIHEYMHHLDDMDRDGEIEIIDQLSFLHAFRKFYQENTAVAENLLDRSDRAITNIFGIGPLSELIAYTAGWVVENPDLCPMYMHVVYADILAVSRLKCGFAP